MNMKRMRGRNHRGGGGGGGGGGGMRHHGGNIPLNRNHVFDSNGPDVRVRGTAQQLFEKYLQLGRDATSSGDRVTAEGYFQHAEHYFRIMSAMLQAQQQGQQNNGHHNGGHPHAGQGNGNGQYAPGHTNAPDGQERGFDRHAERGYGDRFERSMEDGGMIERTSAERPLIERQTVDLSEQQPEAVAAEPAAEAAGVQADLLPAEEPAPEPAPAPRPRGRRPGRPRASTQQASSPEGVGDQPELRVDADA